ncbi:MAG: 2-succinyl-6-hydroxy-2,4-cyclohexadiene-carboxylate synthase, partial [Actinomycetota bacterium]|nr:2-succinyl-6-hydroxy-2,4-cyclohexadiene-carboxylate synthase [Actinomycetota bacterium]
VPGFTQTATAWEPVAERLRAGGHDATAIEVPVGLDFTATVAAIGAVGGSATYVGYSMGGRLCLRLALDRPDLVERLALVSASPGIADADERTARRAADEKLALDVEQRGVEAFLRDWLAQPLFATLDANASGLSDRAAAHTAADLATTLRLLGSGTQEPLWSRLAELRMPVAFVTGRADTKFEQINDAMQAACASTTPVARVHLDGGHALPLEQPEAVASFLLDWLVDEH